MKKIVGYFAVLLVCSWVTTANAGPVMTVTGSNGSLTIGGFSSTIPTNPTTDLNPLTLAFLFSFDSGAAGGVLNVLQPIVAGQTYAADANFTITALATTFDIHFDQLSTMNIAPVSGNLNDLLTPGMNASGTPLGSISVVYNNKTVSLDLLSMLVGGSAGAPIVLLQTLETDPQANLSNYLNYLDINGNHNGLVSSGFTDANLTLSVPEPTTLMLLVGGLLGMLGFSRKSA